MIISMSDILCVTNRALCRQAGFDFLMQLDRIAAARPAGIILREKDLPPEEYTALAEQVLALCARHQVRCLLHTYPQAAQALGCTALHMPLRLLEQMPAERRRQFTELGASCHSAADARQAEALGCTYITFGHVFATSCKPGLEPRGLTLLREVCRAVDIPVYAIGGVTPENISAVRTIGAHGGCVMSVLMQSPDPAALLDRFNCEY